MMISILANLLASAVITTSAAAAPDAAPAPTSCGSPIYDAAHDCKVMADGVAKLECLVMPDGALQSCKVVEETPPGRGFGEAALAKASGAKVAPDPSRPATGKLVTGIPFRFKAEE
jgi:hypothetical protein